MHKEEEEEEEEPQVSHPCRPQVQVPDLALSHPSRLHL